MYGQKHGNRFPKQLLHYPLAYLWVFFLFVFFLCVGFNNHYITFSLQYLNVLSKSVAFPGNKVFINLVHLLIAFIKRGWGKRINGSPIYGHLPMNLILATYLFLERHLIGKFQWRNETLNMWGIGNENFKKGFAKLKNIYLKNYDGAWGSVL